MRVPQDIFRGLFDSAKDKFTSGEPYPLIDEKIFDGILLKNAYDQPSGNDAIREYLERCMAAAYEDVSVRFVILDYYYALARFDSVHILRRRFRENLAFFVRLKEVDDCNGPQEIAWEITNACAIRDWERAQNLYRRLRSTGELAPHLYHAAYGSFLFLAAFDDYDPDDPEDNTETLFQWSVPGIYGPSEFDKLNRDGTVGGLGWAEDFKLPPGRPEEFLRDAKNELEKARDIGPAFRMELRSALARCYMARGEYGAAAAEYRIVAKEAETHQIFRVPELQVRLRLRVADALNLAQDDSGLRSFLNNWIKQQPEDPIPREHLARLEAKQGNWQVAFQHLSEANALNPAVDKDWKATLLVELGTRALSEDQIAEIVRKSLERHPEVKTIIDGMLEHYWPNIRFLSAEVRDSFQSATLLLFESSMKEHAFAHAVMILGRTLERQLRSVVFDKFAKSANASATVRTSGGAKAEPLEDFIAHRGPLTFGAMINYLINVAHPNPGIESSLRDWLKKQMPKLHGALAYRALKKNVSQIRNDATHDTVSRQKAHEFYEACRKWFEYLVQLESR